jgi:hypothetical protein
MHIARFTRHIVLIPNLSVILPRTSIELTYAKPNDIADSKACLLR